MKYEITTPEALRRIAAERISQVSHRGRRKISVFVPPPMPCEPDALGCNWDLVNSAPLDLRDDVETVIRELKARYRLDRQSAPRSAP